MLNFSNASFPYFEFPERIEVILFDKNNNQTKITSDYAISYSNTDLIDLRGNVVVSTHLQDTLITDQLYYDKGEDGYLQILIFDMSHQTKIFLEKVFDSDKTFDKINF